MDFNSKYKSSEIEALLDKVASGNTGGGSGGSGAYAEVNHGTNDTTFTLTPNTFHVWDEVSALTLTLGSETASVANEFLFQFTSGATATSLTLPDDIKWAEELFIEPKRIYQVSILKGLASVLSWDNTSILSINVYYNYDYAPDVIQAKEGMTWEEWLVSQYNLRGYYISDNKIVELNGTFAIVTEVGGSSFVSPTDVILGEHDYGWFRVSAGGGGSGN